MVRSLRRLPLAVVALTLTAACGSTVAMRTGAPVSDGLGPSVPTTATTSGASPTSGSAIGGSTPTVPAGAATAARAPGTAPSVLPGRVLTGPARLTPVQIGVVMPNSNVGTAFSNTYGSSVNPGDVQAMSGAMVAWLNAHGGFGGHQVKPLYYQRCVGCNPSTEAQAICSQFTQDNKVVAAFDVTNESTALGNCLGRHGASSFGGGVGVWDDQDLATMASLWSSYGISADTVFTRLVKRLYTSGWFGNEKIGLVVSTGVPEEQTLKRVATRVKATMSSLGRSFAAEAEVAQLDSASASAAVLQLSSAHVTRLVILDTGSSVLLTMGPAMTSQNYYPEVSVTSLDVLGTAATVISPRVFQGAAGVGWLPTVDAAPNRPARNANELLCQRIYADGKVSTAGPLAGAQAVALCDGMLHAKATYARAAGTSVAQVRTAVASLGTSYLPAATFADHWAPGVYGGASATSDVRYDGTCTCFRYSTKPLPL